MNYNDREMENVRANHPTLKTDAQLEVGRDAWTEDLGVEPACDTCGDGTLAILGVLGSRLHLRCQACGGEYSTTDPAQVSEAEEFLSTIDFY